MSSIYLHSAVALLLRVGLIMYGHYHDNNNVVKYTDVDYHIYTDAAVYLCNGMSPFYRQTYRYSPLLAILMIPNVYIHKEFGKLLFSVVDVISGVLIWKILRNYSVNLELNKVCTFLYLYNPLFAIISTRGSSDSISNAMVLLCILLLQGRRIFLLGIIYGFSVHFRLYPCIYVFAFYSALSTKRINREGQFSKLCNMILPNKSKILFLFCSFLGLAIPTALSYHYCGTRYLNEAILYHVRRKDTRHNFSPYFYFLYLLGASQGKFISMLCSFFPFFFQVVLILVITWSYVEVNALPMSLFAQTFVFVAFNKVCTSQYFVWYLCFFPLILPYLKMSNKTTIKMFSVWGTSQLLWLYFAYLLEFGGTNSFLLIWLSSLFMFVVNIYLLYHICCVYRNEL